MNAVSGSEVSQTRGQRLLSSSGWSPRRPRFWLALIVFAVVVAIGFWLSGDGGELETRPVFEVRRGPLTISVAESGSIRALNQAEIKSEVEGQSTILYLVEEGTHVEKGELLVELDASRLNESLVDQQIRVQNAEAAFIRARENLAVTRNQTEADIARAELDLQFAREDLVKYEQGDFPKQVKELESRITMAREEMEQAAGTLAWSEQLFGEQYISQTELDRDRLAYQRAQLNHDLALADMELLDNFTHSRRLDELRSNAQQAEMSLERVRLRASADIVQAEAELKARESEFSRQRDRLANINQQIEKTRILAPQSGMVVYATTGQARRWQASEPLQEGQTVRERQTLILLPSPGSMMVEVKVHESALEKVRVGQSVRVTVDALPGREYRGRVVRIAPLPDAASSWLNPDLKLYNTDIHLDNATPEIRTGMTCRAEVLVDHYPNALFVPIQAVIRVGNQPTVYVRSRSGEFEPRPVEMGLDNNRMVHVLEGLAEGEVVLLAPPLREADRQDREQAPDEAASEVEPMGAPVPDPALPPSAVESPAPEAGEASPRGGQRRGERGGDMPPGAGADPRPRSPREGGRPPEGGRPEGGQRRPEG